MNKKLIKIPLTLALSLCISLSISNLTRAEKPETAPKELIEVITKIDFAANKHDAKMLEQYISENFATKDGLNYQSFHESLQKLWQNYSNLTYQTKLISWQKKDNELAAETVTEIKGSYKSDGREITLSSNIRSLQFFENGKLISQEILSERTDLTSGEKPPEVSVLLPEKVKVGQQFNFDVIVKEPLGNDLLLGTALEEKIDKELYLKPSKIELESLNSGGIFKLVTAPQTPKDTWLSAVLIRADGMRLITQRVRIEK